MKKIITRDALLLFLGFVLGMLIYFLVSTLFFAPVIMPIFSPDNGDEIIKAIDSAQESIDIEVYVFTSENVVEALKNAYARGVKIRIIMEKRVISGDNQEVFDMLKNIGIDVKWASKAFKLTHSKFIIIDGKKVIVGSHNLSDSALGFNREASVLIEKSAVTDEFKRIFENDWLLAQQV